MEVLAIMSCVQSAMLSSFTFGQKQDKIEIVRSQQDTTFTNFKRVYIIKHGAVIPAAPTAGV